MPITKSAKKALRQNAKRKKRNLIYKHKIAKLVKKIKKLAVLGEKEEIKKLLPAIYKALDKAAKVKIIKKGTAARRKSRIAKTIK
ncbi:30S ribosomal protein S20 [Patescibacteria group bacterium]|nr:30S ribosomal protein S20 [Patescibacteria group bacterium]